MSGSFANEGVMEDYMSDMLSEEPVIDLAQRQSVERLLDISIPQLAPLDLVEEPAQGPVELKEPEVSPRSKPIEAAETIAIARQPKVVDKPFQALFFEVAGLTLALPLTELGGIHELSEINGMLGRPDWYLGVMLHREQKFNAVDTAKWVMPEKNIEKLAQTDKYQYLIILDESGWGLACDRLITTATIEPDEVKWRGAGNKRPWLAGMVKNKMCALIDVEQMIVMLNKGKNSN